MVRTIANALTDAGARPCKVPYRHSHRQYDREGSLRYSTAGLWDDGILDPAETRPALALGLSAAFNAPIPDGQFGVLRM